MAAKMAVYHKKFKKIFPDWQSPGICMQTAYFTDSWITDIILVIPVMLFMHHSAFDIFKMVSKILADQFFKLVGAAFYR